MVDRADVDAWVGRYISAWDTNDPREIGDLFTEDARYFTAPHRVPWSGRENIVAGWLGRKDEPGSWKFRHEIKAIIEDLAFVRGWTDYSDGTSYSNLWEIRLAPDGRCSEFVEWWMVVEARDAAATSP